MSAHGAARPERGGLRGRFERHYGAGPLHLLGTLVVIGITAYVLSIIFERQFAPRPWNLLLWLLGGAVLHDAVFLPIYGVINVLVARVLRAGNDSTLLGSALGPATAADWKPVPPAPTADQQRRVAVINHLRVPFVLSAVLFLVFLPRITDRQPQNFVNALGHAPPDFFGRWVAVTVALFVASALLYGVRWLRASPVG